MYRFLDTNKYRVRFSNGKKSTVYAKTLDAAKQTAMQKLANKINVLCEISMIRRV